MSLSLTKRTITISADEMSTPQGYTVLDHDLIAAANAAMVLGKPLLLTGEPGIGKSEFARWLAAQSPACDLFQFVVKSNTEASELFYQFDAVARFRDAQLANLRGVTDGQSESESQGQRQQLHKYLRYNALGTAILHSLGSDQAERMGVISPALGESYRRFPAQATRSVVLIDEIDKAPRDVPNDILDEILHRRFRIPELDIEEVQANPALLPIVVITSNSERDLPRAFLRRCIYYHMRLRDDVALLLQIAANRIGRRFSADSSLLGDCIRMFVHLRTEVSLNQKPGFAELLDWLAALAGDVPAPARRLGVDDKAIMKAALLKDTRDQELADRDWDSWRARVVSQA